jgi:superfamily II DNA or RNA helicase/predicted transcriptional regulator
MKETIFARPVRTSRVLSANMQHAVSAIRGHLKKEHSILFPKQVDVVQSIADTIHSGHRAVYVDLPTGTGKTVIFSQIINALLREGYKVKVLIVTSSMNLVVQTKLRFEEHAPNISVGLYYTHKKELNQPVIVTTYASLPYFARYHANKFDFLVWDEAHLSLSDSRIEYRKKFTNAIWLALTATPSYSQNKALSLHFALAYRITMQQAVDSGLICGFRNIKVSCQLAKMKEVKISNTGDFHPVSLDKAVNIHSRNKSAAQFYETAIDPYTGNTLLGKRGIINCVSIDHAYSVSKVFQKTIKSTSVGATICEAIHGRSKEHHMSPKLRKQILEAHRHGEILLLANADLLTLGHDDKKIELCMNLAPSLSLVNVVQRGGRATRFDEKNPYKTALIVDFFDEGTELKRNALLYGDVIGQGSCILPEVQNTFLKDRSLGATVSHYIKPIKVGEDFLKKLKVYWHTEEVNAIIKQNKIIREQGSLLGWKKDDELSAFDIAREVHADFGRIYNILEALKPVKKIDNQYYDPKQKNKNRLTFHIVHRDSCGKEVRCLKKEDLEKFCNAYKFYEIKKEDDLSIEDVAKKIEMDPSTVRKIVNELQPLSGSKELYYHPKLKDPVTFRIVYRRLQHAHTIRCLKKSELEKFKTNFAPHANKKPDELSALEISKRLKMGNETVTRIIQRLCPKAGSKDLFVDPQNSSKTVITFKIVVRRFTGRTIRCLKECDLNKFREVYAPLQMKQKGELSAVDISNRLKIDVATVRKILNRLRPVSGNPNSYFDPQQAETIKSGSYIVFNRRAKQGAIRCLSENSLELFAFQYKLDYRK